MITEELKVREHSWAADKANITLTAMNTGTCNVSVEKIRVCAADSNITDVAETDVAPSNVTYGPAFSGTAHTLLPRETGTITITYQFSSGIKYELTMVSATGNSYTYVTTAL
jgi:hypothetical protein